MFANLDAEAYDREYGDRELIAAHRGLLSAASAARAAVVVAVCTVLLGAAQRSACRS